MSQTTQNGTLDDKVLVEKLLELKDLYKKKKTFTDEDIPSLKPLFKDLPHFRDLAPSVRNDILVCLEVHELKRNDMLLKSDQRASCYVVVSGRVKKSVHAPWNVQKEEEDKKDLDIISQRQLFQEFTGLSVLGNFDLLNIDKFSKKQSNWNPCYLYALENNTIVYSLNYDKVETFMEKLVISLKISQKQSFLVKSVPGLSNLLSSNREKVLSLFTQVNFIQNQTIINEQSQPTFAYIIQAGHCSLQSKSLPEHLTLPQTQKKKTFSTTSRKQQGFQLGIISENQWVGEEVLLIAQQERYNQLLQAAAQDQEPTDPLALPDLTLKKPSLPVKPQGFQYSVIAKTNVTAYAISKDDLMTKLPKDLQQLINKQAVKKQEWISNRYLQILKGQRDQDTNEQSPSTMYQKRHISAKDTEFLLFKRSTSVSTMLPNKIENLPKLESIKNSAALLPSLDRYEQNITISEAAYFHKNPFEAQKNVSPSRNLDQGKMQKYPSRPTLNDQISSTLSPGTETLEPLAQNDFSPKAKKSPQMKVFMDSAAYIKTTSNNRLYLPTLIKNPETDKKAKAVSKYGQARNSTDIGVSNYRRQEQLEVTVGEKKVKFLQQPISERRTIYM